MRGGCTVNVVFIITRADDLGGAQTHVRELAGALAGRGVRVTVLAGGSVDWAGLGTREGVKFCALKHLVRPIRPWRDLLAFFEIRALLRELAPDLVTTHSNKAGLLGRAAARSLRTPVLHTSHGWLFSEGKRDLCDLFFRLAEKMAAMWADRVIAVSESERDLAQKRSVIRAEKMVVIHNGLPDVDERYRSALGRKDLVEGLADGWSDGRADDPHEWHSEVWLQGRTKSWAKSQSGGPVEGLRERRAASQIGSRDDGEAASQIEGQDDGEAERQVVGRNYGKADTETDGWADGRTANQVEGLNRGKGDRDEEAVRLVMVARFTAPKDHRTLLLALGALRDLPWRLSLVGDGPGLPEARAAARSLGLAEKVFFLGMREDTLDILAAGDIFILSSAREGFPISILEAMRAGLPVVASAVGGVGEAVVDGESGLLFPAGDAESLCKSLERLITEPDLRRSMGAAGRKRYQEQFTLEQMAEKTLSLYLAVLAERGR